jgi:hypothetical protein
VHSREMRWWARLAWAVVGFIVPLVAVYNLYVRTQPVHHDLSDIATGLFGACLGLVAGVIGAVVALVYTGRRGRRQQ